MKLVVILFLSVLLAVICTAGADADNSKTISSSEAGAGSKGGKKYSEDKHTKKSGKKSKHWQEKGRKGHDFKELHKVEDEEGGGKKAKFQSQDSHKSYKKSGGGSTHGLKYEEGSKHKKNNFKQGFREKYHKDEANNHDSFYSNGHKSGEYKVFGKGHEKHSAKSLSKKQGSNRKKGKSGNNHGKAFKKAGGHNISEKKGYQRTKSSKSHHGEGGSFGKKGGRSNGKQYYFNGGIPDFHK